MTKQRRLGDSFLNALELSSNLCVCPSASVRKKPQCSLEACLGCCPVAVRHSETLLRLEVLKCTPEC